MKMHVLRIAAAAALACSIPASPAQGTTGAPAPAAPAFGAPNGPAALHARWDALADQVAHSPYGKPLVLESVQSGDRLEGKVYAKVDQPYAAIQSALQGTDHWCSILILHLNVKMCHAQPAGLDMALGRKYDQPVDDAYKLHFDYRLAASGPGFLQAQLGSADGPLGTHDYRIVVEAMPLDASHSLVYMSYAYGFGFTARVAMNAYLSTVGAGKVGFSVVGKEGDGKPVYVGGVRGLVERNTMRYYLAIEDYAAAPAPSQLERRLSTWFDATERYPRQLHEVDKADYMAMKRNEARR
ncbi:MAG TPA: hypothetical protein VF457_01850 [Burkholderiaceae bacterium]